MELPSSKEEEIYNNLVKAVQGVHSDTIC